MDAQKLEVIEKMEAKGLTPAKVAELIEFSPNILSLYLVKDAYPVPTRILDKVAAALAA